MGGISMLGKRRQRMIICNCKPIEKMTPEERDKYFMSFSGMTYAEFNEKFKDDTIEKIEADMDKHIKTI